MWTRGLPASSRRRELFRIAVVELVCATEFQKQMWANEGRIMYGVNKTGMTATRCISCRRGIEKSCRFCDATGGTVCSSFSPFTWRSTILAESLPTQDPPRVIDAAGSYLIHSKTFHEGEGVNIESNVRSSHEKKNIQK